MSNSNKKTDKEKGDAVLRQMLKTPPKPKEKDGDKKSRSPVIQQDEKKKTTSK